MTHEFDGNKYGKASSHQREWGVRLISELNVPGTERVFDLGIGRSDSIMLSYGRQG